LLLAEVEVDRVPEDSPVTLAGLGLQHEQELQVLEIAVGPRADVEDAAAGRR